VSALRDGAPGQLQRLFCDTALSTSEFVFGALKEFVPTSQILCGSDFPFALRLFPKFAKIPATAR
jgi:hypothetical protein